MKVTKQYSVLLELTQEEADNLATLMANMDAKIGGQLRLDIFRAIRGREIDAPAPHNYYSSVGAGGATCNEESFIPNHGCVAVENMGQGARKDVYKEKW